MIEWRRVTKDNPCKVCGKPDWCTFTDDGAACMRVDSGHPMRNGGWWHRHTQFATTHFVSPTRSPKKVEGKIPDFDSILSNADHTRLGQLSAELHVTYESLDDLGTVYLSMYHAYGFPMSLSNGKVIGIRLRNNNGKKWAIGGSHAGLFIPHVLAGEQRDLFICEGPTDTAAALSIGLFAIGRHACSGQEEMVVQVIRDRGVKRVYICCDNDAPGRQGAAKLAKMIKCKWSIFTPPAKDLREFVAFGGSRDLLFSMLRDVQSIV